MRKIPRAIDLFAGCGGLSHGLRCAGFKIVSAVELNDLAVSTYKANHQDVNLVHGDIRNVTGKELIGNEDKIEVVAGCPPCQGFSRVRRRNRKKAAQDDRNNLIGHFTRVVEEIEPTSVFMENVPGIENDGRFKTFLHRLEDLGYVVNWDLLELADYGVPQWRMRVVVLAGKGFQIPMPTPCRVKRTVKGAIQSLPNPKQCRNRLHQVVTQHSPATLERIRAVPKNGGSRCSWPEELHLKCHYDCSGFKDVYGRMAWDEPAPTITGGCINASKGRFLHPVQHRAITLLEAAILQTFPRRYYFDDLRGRYAIAEMIGNAFRRFLQNVSDTHLLHLWRNRAMGDVFSRAKRSEIMSKIKGKNTAPELRVRRLLHALGYRFRLHRNDIPGKPDIVLPRHKKVILIHGCFWHCHPNCPRAALPTTNLEFWQKKIAGNRARDRRVRLELRKLGWRVLVLWQCQLKHTRVLVRRLQKYLED